MGSDAEHVDLRQIKAMAKSELGGLQGVEGFGIGDGTLRVYVRNWDVSVQLPRVYLGVPVDFIVTGDITAQP